MQPFLKNMKNNFINKKLNMFSIVDAFRDSIISEPMVSLGNSFELLVLVNRLGWRVILACSDKPINVTKRLNLLRWFAKYLLQMKKHHGAMYTVKYLKSCQLALQKRISGDHISSLRDIESDLPFPRLTRSSLPRIIPLADRRSILSGNTFVIRLWMSIFSIYRVIRVEGVLKLNTITDPYSGDDDYLLRGCEDLLEISKRNSYRFDKTVLEKEFGVLALETASPSYKTSLKGFISDVFDLTYHGIDKPLLEYLSATGQTSLMLTFMHIREMFEKFPYSKTGQKERLNRDVGQLSMKEEAAGKIRVFALVDVWTQSCLKPLHEMLFKFLRGLPNDGTFDQHASVLRCAEKVERSGQSFGYDLSAATDRLPIALQVAVLTPLIGKSAAENWRQILVGRSYSLFSPKVGTERYYYAVGQPMGALSSWAMLAVTHHFIVQRAFQIARPVTWSQTKWYDNYELLGDDIVIFDKDVALVYLDLMKFFGVGINLKKSVVATNNSFEFAKVSYSKGAYVSAVSWKMFVSQNSLMGRVNIAYFLLNIRELKHPIAFLKNILRKSTYELGDYKFNLIALVSMFANAGKITFSELLKALTLIRSGWNRKIIDAKNDLNVGYFEQLIVSLYRKEELPLRKNVLLDTLFRDDLPWYMQTLMNRLIMIRHKLGSSDDVTILLAKKLSDLIVPGLIPDHLKSNTAWMSHELSSSEMNQAVLFMNFWKWADHLLGDMSFYNSDFRHKRPNWTLDEFIALTGRFDRLIELLEISERAIAKDAGIVKPRVLEKSSLHSLKFMLKANRKRPSWTFITHLPEDNET